MTTYPETVLADSPSVYYRMGEASGTVMADAAGNNRHGAYVGVGTLLTLGAPGLLVSDDDTAADFDGSGGGRATVAAYGGVFAVPQFTVEAWIETGSVPDSRTISILDRDEFLSSGQRAWQFRVAANTGRLQFLRVLNGGGSFAVVTAESSVSVRGGVHHVVATYDGATIRLYVDGAADGTAAASGGILQAAAMGMLIGRNGSSSTNGETDFGGTIDEVAFYPTALDADRVLAHYLAGIADPPDPPDPPDPVGFDPIDLVCGDAYATQLLGDAYSITVRRGLRSSGLTDDLEPAVLTAIVKGSELVSPLANPDVRPRRPIQLRATDDGGTTWATLYTGTIDRVQYEHDPADKDDDADYRVIITATDLVTTLAGKPSEVASTGNLTQRVAAVMDPTGLPYTVSEPADAVAVTPLPTDAKDVVGQLRLIRDTAHALIYVNSDGELVAVSDNARPRNTPVADHFASDDIDTPGAIQYHDITPVFDTDTVVNVLTVKTLDGADNPEVTYTDETSRDDWGDKAAGVTVNDGFAETHADLYLASRVTPDLVPDRVAFTVLSRHPQAREPHGRPEHLTTACAVELYDSVRVTRHDVPTVDLLVREIAHTITPNRWTCELGLRRPETLATRWDDVPADLTWDDLDPTMTWDQAVRWHPYL